MYTSNTAINPHRHQTQVNRNVSEKSTTSYFVGCHETDESVFGILCLMQSKFGAFYFVHVSPLSANRPNITPTVTRDDLAIGKKADS